jgi:hypothetical protein
MGKARWSRTKRDDSGVSRGPSFRVATSCVDTYPHHGRSVDSHVANLTFELGVESIAAETELVLVVLSMLNPRSCKKTVCFPR